MPVYQPPLKGVSLSEAYAEAAAIAPVSRVMLHTFELNHASLAEPFRIVNDNAPLTAAIEGSPGGMVEFMAAYVVVTRAEESDTASSPQVTLTIDNVAGELTSALRAARGSRAMWTVTERIYASDDLTGPAVLPSLTLTVVSAESNGTSSVLTLAYGDPVNVNVPAITFKREEYPGLSAR